jgi:transcriptional regulator with XRE-family HTH domain
VLSGAVASAGRHGTTGSRADNSFAQQELLRGFRLQAGLSQEALAGLADLSVHAVSDLERGARRLPYPDTVQRLANALGISDVNRTRLGDSGRRHPSKGEVPSIATSNALPAQPNVLIGRGREIQEIVERMRRPSVRLPTLTGPGGIGKTRLAIAAAEELVNDFVDGVAFADLSPSMTRGSSSPFVHMLGASEVGASPSLGLLQSHLRASRVLLVLDNCEHVLDVAGSLGELLATCPGLKVLATSREALRLQWEHVFPVPALSVPDPAQLPAPRGLEEFAAWSCSSNAQRLPVRRSRSGPSTRTIAALTYRLDSLPLAIELAAARHVSLPPSVLLERLDQRLDVLRGGRDVVARCIRRCVRLSTGATTCSPSAR